MKSKTKKKGSFYVRRRKEVFGNCRFKERIRKRTDASGSTPRHEFFRCKRGVLCAVRTIRFRKIHNIIGGIDNADSGYININGDKLEDMSEKKLTQYRRKHLGYVFQMYNLIGNLNVKENIEVGAYLSDNALDIDDLLHTLGLYEHRYKLPNQLSGGQQQRVSIGRAIVKNPDILLCDEPTGALDYNTSKEILKLIEEVNKKYGNTIIMVTHNEAIKNMADHVIKLRDGAVRHNDINTNKVSAEDLEW